MSKISVKERTRKTDAKIIRGKNNKATIICPFCKIPHPIGLEPSVCGTKLEVKAVQTIYTGAVCALCGKSGGNFIKVGNAYAHEEQCSPGKILFRKPPKLSPLAKLVYKMPDPITKFFSKRGRTAIEVSDPSSKKVIGYAWVKT